MLVFILDHLDVHNYFAVVCVLSLNTQLKNALLWCEDCQDAKDESDEFIFVSHLFRIVKFKQVK